MDSKSGQTKSSAGGEAYEHPVGSCNHLISTSLRDLSLEYQKLSLERGTPMDGNPKKPSKMDEEKKSLDPS